VGRVKIGLIAAGAIVLASCGSNDGTARPASGMSGVFAAWEAASDFNELHKPATEQRIAQAETDTGRTFPSELVALYGYANGGGVLQGNILIEPLEGLDDLQRDARAPKELLLFGSDGSDSLFGLWSVAGKAPSAVVEYDPGGGEMALVGSSLTPFLRGRSAYYLMLLDSDAGLDALGVPERLRAPSAEMSDEALYDLRHWADPSLEESHGELYEHGISAAELRRRYGAAP
jgi:hypothetical protein